MSNDWENILMDDFTIPSQPQVRKDDIVVKQPEQLNKTNLNQGSLWDTVSKTREYEEQEIADGEYTCTLNGYILGRTQKGNDYVALNYAGIGEFNSFKTEFLFIQRTNRETEKTEWDVKSLNKARTALSRLLNVDEEQATEFMRNKFVNEVTTEQKVRDTTSNGVAVTLTLKTRKWNDKTTGEERQRQYIKTEYIGV